MATFKELVEAILLLEKEHHLFDREIGGVHYWKIIRYQIIHELSKKCGLYTTLAPKDHKRLFPAFVALTRQVYNTLFHSAFSVTTPLDHILVPHTRKILLNGEISDMYTAHIEKTLRDSNASYLVIEKGSKARKTQKPSKNRKFDTLLDLHALLNTKKRKRTLSEQVEQERQAIRVVLDTLTAITPNKTPLSTLSTKQLVKKVLKFQETYTHYSQLFKKTKPKMVTVVVGYGKEPLIAAAQDLAIPVTELQHGTISPYHLGYHFPEMTSIPYFPDKLLLWGEFWGSKTAIPAILGVTGFPYLDSEIKKYPNKKSTVATLLVIGQPTSNKDLMTLTIAFAKAHRDTDIAYRLHPADVSDWQTRYPSLVAATKALANLTVTLSKEISLYEQLSQTTHVLGAYSTVLIEALAFGCHVALINTPGIEHYEQLLDEKIFALIHSPAELNSFLHRGVVQKVSLSSYFAPITH